MTGYADVTLAIGLRSVAQRFWLEQPTAHVGALGAPTCATPSRERRSHNSLLRTTTNFGKKIATYVRIGVDRCTPCVELLVVSDSDVTSIRAGDA